MKSYIILLFCCLCCFRELHAQKSSAKDVLHPNFDGLDKQTRLTYAKTLLAEVESIFDAIPNVSPEQSEWLEKEWKRIDKLKGTNAGNANMGSLLESKEYSLWRAKQGFQNMQTVLHKMEAAEKSNTALQAWLLVSYELTDEDTFFYLDRLVKQGTVKLTVIGEDSPLMRGFRYAIGRDIMKKIVFEGVRRLESRK